MKLNERIRDCRIRSGLTQEQVAEAMDVSRQAVTKWENGQSAPSTEKLFKLAELFGTTVDLILPPRSETDGEERESGFIALLRSKNFWISVIAGLVLLLTVCPYGISMYIPIIFNLLCVFLDIWTAVTFSVLLYLILSRSQIGEEAGTYCSLLIMGIIGHAIFSVMFWGCWLCLGLSVGLLAWVLIKKWSENKKNSEKST